MSSTRDEYVIYNTVNNDHSTSFRYVIFFFLQAPAGRDQLVAERVRELSGQQETDGDVRPECAPQLFRENAASAESIPSYLVPSQQGEGAVHGIVQVNLIIIYYTIWRGRYCEVVM